MLPKILLIIFILASQQYTQQFRLTRPVPDNIQTNGSYLLGEPNFQNPSLAHHGIDDENLIANSFRSFQNYPKPFNLETKISYTLDEDDFISLSVYNLLEVKIFTIVVEE